MCTVVSNKSLVSYYWHIDNVFLLVIVRARCGHQQLTPVLFCFQRNTTRRGDDAAKHWQPTGRVHRAHHQEMGQREPRAHPIVNRSRHSVCALYSHAAYPLAGQPYPSITVVHHRGQHTHLCGAIAYRPRSAVPIHCRTVIKYYRSAFTLCDCSCFCAIFTELCRLLYISNGANLLKCNVHCIV